MAAALMAIEHFNTRNPVVVPELAHMASCSVQIPLGDGTEVVDTEMLGGVGGRAVLAAAEGDNRPCALVGAPCDLVGIAMSYVAAASQIPLILFDTTSTTLGRLSTFPFTTFSGFDRRDLSLGVVDSLSAIGRTNYVTLLSSVSDTAVEIATVIETVLINLGSTHLVHLNFGPNSDFVDLVERVKQTGFRTIVIVATDHDTIVAIADAAVKHGLLNGDYYILLCPISVGDFVALGNIYPNVTKLLDGAASVTFPDGFMFDKADTFLTAWKLWTPRPDTISLLTQMHPLPEGSPGHPNITEVYGLSDGPPSPGSGFMYDAVIAAGIGACKTEADRLAEELRPNRGTNDRNERDLQEHSVVSKGESSKSFRHDSPPIHFGSQKIRRRTQKSKAERLSDYEKFVTGPVMKGILTSSFWGATGYHTHDITEKKASTRLKETAVLGRHNFRRNNEGMIEAVLTDVLVDANYSYGISNVPATSWTDVPIRQGNQVHSWVQFEPFRYANRETNPPALLRDPPNQNFMSRSVRAVGLSLMTTALLFAFVMAYFVIRYRNHSVMKAGQPEFLLSALFGVVLIAITLATSSFDEGIGFSKRQLDISCMVTPWFLVVGYIVVQGSLFCSLWRVNRVVQVRVRTTVSVKDVLRPFVALLAVVFVLLSSWSIASPMKWEREVLDAMTEESTASCTSKSSIAFFISLCVVIGVATCMTCFMAWTTRDVDSRWADSNRIFYAIFVQLQILIVGLPIVLLLDGTNSSVDYLARALVTWLVCVTTTGLLVVPKVIAIFHQTKKEVRGGNVARGVQIYNPNPNGRRNVSTEDGTSKNTRDSQKLPLEESDTEQDHMIPDEELRAAVNSCDHPISDSKLDSIPDEEDDTRLESERQNDGSKAFRKSIEVRL